MTARIPAHMMTTNIGAKPPFGENGFVEVSARAIVDPALLREDDMEDMVRVEGRSTGKCAPFWL